MSLTPEQLEARKKHIGSSDVSMILNCHPFGLSAFDLWLEKTGRLPEKKSNDLMEIGNALEPLIMDYAESKLGAIERSVYRECKSLPVIASNLDGMVISTGEPVEGKSSNVQGFARNDFGEEGTDNIPNGYILQVQTQLVCVDDAIEQAHVAAWIGGRGKCLFTVKRSVDLCNIIIEEAAKFWACVESDTPPEGSLPSLESLSKMRRQPKTIVPIDGLKVARWKKMEALRKRVVEREEELKREVLTELGDAEAGDYGDSETILTYYAESVKAHWRKESTRRVARVAKRKLLT